MTEPTVPGGISPFEAPSSPQAPSEALTGPQGVTTATAPPEGPRPLLKGAFSIYITPEHAIVLAYRPEGSAEDKQLLVPPFILDMAARQSGATPEELISRFQEGM